MSKKNKSELSPLDDSILKMILDKLSALQSEVVTLQSRIQHLEVKNERA